jgi:hypothetical protein
MVIPAFQESQPNPLPHLGFPLPEPEGAHRKISRRGRSVFVQSEIRKSGRVERRDGTDRATPSLPVFLISRFINSTDVRPGKGAHADAFENLENRKSGRADEESRRRQDSCLVLDSRG